jgi:hypothetical protein
LIFPTAFRPADRISISGLGPFLYFTITSILLSIEVIAENKKGEGRGFFLDAEIGIIKSMNPVRDLDVLYIYNSKPKE